MNNPIHTIIIDDQPVAIDTLKKSLSAFPEIVITGAFSSAGKAKRTIISQQPDLLFLDIEIGETNGIEFLQEIRPEIHSNMCVVCYSAFDKYMLEALRNSVFDYLLKPYREEELELIIDRVKKKQKEGKVDWEQSIRRLLPLERKIIFQGQTELILLKSSEVLCFVYHQDIRCWHLVQTNRKEHKLRTTTNSREILKSNLSFIQINQECILNINYLVAIEHHTLRCVLSPGMDYSTGFFVSRRYYSKVREELEMI